MQQSCFSLGTLTRASNTFTPQGILLTNYNTSRCKDYFAADVGHVRLRGSVVGSQSWGRARRREEKAKVGHWRRGEEERDETGAERN